MIILIQDDLWRSECIAAITIDEDEKVLQVLPVSSPWDGRLEYEYDDLDELIEDYKRVAALFVQYCGGQS